MITMTYAEINNQNFLQALSQLAHERVPAKVAYNIKRIADSVMSARKRISDEYRKEIIEVFAKKNPDGSVAYEKGPNGEIDPTQFEIDETRKEEHRAAEVAFATREVKIERQKLYLEAIQNIDISATMLDALDPVLTEMVIVTGGNDAPANAS